MAAWSHQRAGAAQAAGLFDVEIAPVTIPQRKGDPVVVTADEGVRPDSTPETLARLRPAFAQDGDDHRGQLLAAQRRCGGSRAHHARLCREARSRVARRAGAHRARWPARTTRCTPSRPTRCRRRCRAAGWQASDLDFVEINEAFAAVSLHSSRELGSAAGHRQHPRRRHRHRASDRRIRSPSGAPRGARVEAARHRQGRRVAVRRRRSGRGAAALALTRNGPLTF